MHLEKEKDLTIQYLKSPKSNGNLVLSKII